MIIFLPILLFSIILAPYLFLIPGGDGNGQFKLAYYLINGNYSPQLLVFHPPFKLFLFDFFLLLFGPWSTGLVGLLLGITGIIAFYYISKEFFSQKIAILSACLLAISGLYLSLGAFSIDDFVMTVMILVAFAFYLKSKYILYAIFSTCAVLTKETAIFFVISVFIVAIINKRKHFIEFLAPVVALLIWTIFLYANGQHLWNAYNFSTTKSQGSIYTMLHNLITFGFFNEYAYENWLHVFVFNYNWIYTIFAFIALFFLPKNKNKDGLIIIALFSLLFLTMVLGFQTWTINRYTLPLLPFLYLFAIYGATKIRYTTVWLVIIYLAALLSLAGSTDPLSQAIWPQVQIFDQKFFDSRIDGGDGITYNLQYLNVMQRRTSMLIHGQCDIPYLLSYDTETLKFLGIHTCLNTHQ